MPQPFPFYETRNGFRTATILSGWNSGTNLNACPNAITITAGAPDTVLFSGPGRLNSILPIIEQSGTRCLFYDAVPSTATSGGPFVLSGHRIVGVMPANTFLAAGTLGGPTIINQDMPFYSGLCVAARSGVAGFTVSFTPEYNPLFAG